MRFAARTRFASPAKVRASPSSTNTASTALMASVRCSLFPSIQKFMLSRATSLGLLPIWARTSICMQGSALARNR